MLIKATQNQIACHPYIPVQYFEQRLRKWFRHLLVVFFYEVPIGDFGPNFYFSIGVFFSFCF